MRGSEWLLDDILIVGFDDSEEDESEEEESDEEESEDDDESEEDEESEEEEDDEKAELEQAKAQLKKALNKERKDRREAQKQMKSLQKQLDELKPKGSGGSGKGGKSDDEKSEEDAESKRKLAAAEARSERLAERLARSAVDTAIIQVAAEAKMPKFTDVEDVLKLLNRDEIDFEQDDEDPSSVDVDKETIRDALKDLAKTKKHLLIGDNGKGGGKTGSKFGGGNSNRGKTSMDALKKKYPALGGRRGV